MLAIEGLQASYGPSQALFDVRLTVPEGALVAMLGRNGMGKTTTIRTLMGLLPARAGRVEWRGRSIVGLAPERVARLGLGLVPEGRLVFPTLTVRENLVATAHNRRGRHPPWTLARVHALFPRLAERSEQRAATLSGGEQQMLAIGRALMTNPDLLILDEATEGLAPVIRADIWRCLAAIKAEGLSILVIDKNLHALKRLADRFVVIEKGCTVWEGDAAALERDEAVVHRLVGV
jgi:branched-chain amino acid transport system ATP-binding protein